METKAKKDDEQKYCSISNADDDEGDGDDTLPGEEAGQLYNFDDIPLYTRVYYMGRLGWVTGKGEDVCPGSGGRHLKIQYKGTFAGRKYSDIHERLINKQLRTKEKLWVDWGFRFCELEEAGDQLEEDED